LYDPAVPPLIVDVQCVWLEGDAALIAAARGVLGADEIARADRFVLPDLADTFALARGSLRVLLANRLGVGARDVTFEYGEKGKPALANPRGTTLRFNVSHSGALLVCALVEGEDVGIDVEQHRPLRDRDRLAQRFFSAEECADLAAWPEADRTRVFFECWSRKEAFIKAVGGGLSIPLGSFRVSLASSTTSALLACRPEDGPAEAWTIHPFDAAAGYSGALAIKAAPVRVDVHHTTAKALLSTCAPG